jgi:hypothetical protein
METLIVRYPPASEAVLLQRLGELSSLGVRVETAQAALLKAAGPGAMTLEEAGVKFEEAIRKAYGS